MLRNSHLDWTITFEEIGIFEHFDFDFDFGIEMGRNISS